ncbi:hypothetical protein [Streptomyces xiaopingdaonensis]|uniref:SCO4983 family protein n=1 Tax=Streptomyces xiaopingdaonensis TaxID=1565415 RepID=UPI0002F47387|nr:hypothetical protein [Streptomyces xiaopingdaonensis]
MYEPIRTKSVHSVPDAELPRRTREEELDIRLAGHLTALLTVTDELRALTPSAELDDAAHRLAAHAARLSGGVRPLRAAPTSAPSEQAHLASLHQRAHMLADYALALATTRDDAEAAALAAERARSHAARQPAAA